MTLRVSTFLNSALLPDPNPWALPTHGTYRQPCKNLPLEPWGSQTYWLN